MTKRDLSLTLSYYIGLFILCMGILFSYDIGESLSVFGVGSIVHTLVTMSSK